MSSRPAARYTIVVTESGTVEVEPGEHFTADDCDRMAVVVRAVQATLG